MASDSEMIKWALAHPSPGEACAGRRRLVKKFGISRTEGERISSLARQQKADEPVTDSLPPNEITDDGETLTAKVNVLRKAGQAAKVADALAHPYFKAYLREADIDLEAYDREISVRQWDVTVKTESGGAETKTNYYFSIKLKPKKHRPILDALEKIEKRLMACEKRPKSVCAKNATTDGLLLEVALYDHHFGSLCWAQETGENYDLSIARRVQKYAIDEIARRCEKEKIAEILLPIGNDYLHVNNPDGVTPLSKNGLDVEGRLAKVYGEAAMAIRDSIESLAEIAPVKLIWVPGNHDPQTSYFLIRELRAWFDRDKRVGIDISPKAYKVVVWNNIMIGLMHLGGIGKSREKELAGWLADEAGDLWRGDQYREIHTGHYHKRGELSFAGASSYGSVLVRKIPSMCGTDFWHYSKGFTNPTKIAQYFLYEPECLRSVEHVRVPADMYK